ncbi:MAG: Rpn family recombination-promoting nuclease/putative transposase [Alkalinema sp. RU_4_3]|nr:Rpn family recombination-promoting nuclease/putative transposase [Alkalinema sp. RU_4_3]
MVYPLQDKYISLLTDFGFKRIFGTEPNKKLLIDFLNTLLPSHHQIADLTFRNTEQLGSTSIDHKAIFDIYCQAISGERFIVEIQKAKQNFFKDRSIYYATFPIQEQALKGEWNYELSAVYTVGVLDFIFDDHKNENKLLHIIQLKDQECEVFYDKLKFIYIELPKFTKTLDQLTTHFDKWLYLLKHLAELSDRPQPLQEEIFNDLFEAAEIANFSPIEQDTYQNSLKYYRDMNNVVDTAREEGRAVERAINLDRQRSLTLRFLTCSLGDIPDDIQAKINQLPIAQLERFHEALLDFTEMDDAIAWLEREL